MVVALKRFKVISSNYVVKNVKFVEFKEELDLSPWTLQKNNEKLNCKYSLYAICMHFGSLHGGHYISYVKSECKFYYIFIFSNGEWFKMNDEMI